MKRFGGILLAVFMAAAGTLGCAGGSGLSDGTVYITVADKADNVGINAWINLRQAEFEAANPNIRITHVPDPFSGTDKTMETFINTMQVANAPTAIRMSGISNIMTARATDLIVDLDGVLEDWTDGETLEPKLREALTRNGKLVSFPLSMEVPLIGFNRKLLDRFGVTEAEVLAVDTWEKYRAVGARLSSVEDKISGIGVWMTDYNLGLEIWNASNRFRFAQQNADGTITLNFTDPTTIETLEFIRGLAADDIYQTEPNLGMTDYFQEIFENRVASFVFYPSWAASWFTPSGLSSRDIVCIPFPKGPSAEERLSVVSAIGYVLSSKATPEECRAAVKYLSYMYGAEAWTERFAFAAEEAVPDLVLPPYTTVDTGVVFESQPASWRTSLDFARSHLTVVKLNSTAFATNVQTLVPSLVSRAAYPTEQDVVDALRSLQNTVTQEWLNGYNAANRI